jgi:hypothetical protein
MLSRAITIMVLEYPRDDDVRGQIVIGKKDIEKTEMEGFLADSMLLNLITSEPLAGR